MRTTDAKLNSDYLLIGNNGSKACVAYDSTKYEQILQFYKIGCKCWQKADRMNIKEMVKRILKTMPHKKLEDRITDPTTRFTFRQPMGVDLRRISENQNMKIQKLIRVALLDYLKRNNLYV